MYVILPYYPLNAHIIYTHDPPFTPDISNFCILSPSLSIISLARGWLNVLIFSRMNFRFYWFSLLSFYFISSHIFVLFFPLILNLIYHSFSSLVDWNFYTEFESFPVFNSLPSATMVPCICTVMTAKPPKAALWNVHALSSSEWRLEILVNGKFRLLDENTLECRDVVLLIE